MTEEGRAAYDLLRKYRHMVARERELEERIERCHDQAMRATSSMGASRGSGGADRSRLESAEVRAIDLEKQLQRTMASERAKRLRIQAAINAIDCIELRRVLELRYIDGMIWEDINAQMHIAASTSKRWHNMALEDFWEIYDHVDKDKHKHGPQWSTVK